MMKTLMLSVGGAEKVPGGVRLSRGIERAAFAERPALGKMIQGCTLELRRPDGTIADATLLTYGISVRRGPDGKLYVEGRPEDQPIVITLAGDLEPEDVPPGTEVYLITPS